MGRVGVALVAVLLGVSLSLSPATSRGDELPTADVSDTGTATSDGGCRPHLAEWSLRIAGGGSRRVQYYALHGDIGFLLWERADRWLTAHGVAGRWVIEPWAGFVNDEHNPHKTSGFEIGVNPLFGKLTFGDWRLRPFLEGGEGVLYTDRRKEQLGSGGFFFSSQVGAGVEYALRPNLALSFAIRYRHISTAGITSANAGLNTLIALVGVTFR